MEDDDHNQQSLEVVPQYIRRDEIEDDAVDLITETREQIIEEFQDLN
jgi:hypothetical protein